jgi:hypothetical protein
VVYSPRCILSETSVPEHQPPPPEPQPTPPEPQPTPPEPQPTRAEPLPLTQPPPPAPPPRPRVPIPKRPWLPLTICLLLAVAATALTLTAIVDRDEASRAIETAQQRTKQVEKDIAEEEESLEEANEARRKLREASSDCRRTANLVVEWMETLNSLLEEAQTGSFQSVLTAATRSEAARRNLLPDLRSCRRQATKVT